MNAIGFTLSTLGKLMVAYMAVKVHYRFWKEHKLDNDVFSTMKKEQIIGITGIALMIIGYFLEIPYKF